MASTCGAVAPRQRSTATVSVFSAMCAWMALATPIPPNRSATSPTIPRNRLSCSTASVRSCSVSSTVSARTRASRNRSRLASANCSAVAPVAGNLTSVSYVARLPKPTSFVSSRYRCGMITRGPSEDAMPTSPGTFWSVPMMRKLE